MTGLDPRLVKVMGVEELRGYVEDCLPVFGFRRHKAYDALEELVRRASGKED